MKAGDFVEVVRGRHTGRTGQIDAIWIEGIAVRLATAGPFGDVVILEHADLKRLRKPRRGRLVRIADETAG